MQLMRLIDVIYTEHPFYGTRRIRAVLKRTYGLVVNRKRIRRLMQLMGICAIYPKKQLSLGNKQHLKYPYLLRGLQIVRPNQVWGLDITYIRMSKGWVYLVAVLDWYSRYVVAWEIAITLEASFCLDVLERAYQTGKAEIVNNDQGSQFTSDDFIQMVEVHGSRVSMDGRGRAFDNIFTERLWRSVKQEEVYLKEYETVAEVRAGLAKYFDFYNHERPHQSLGYETPAEVYQRGRIFDENIPYISIKSA
jgi:putative transposase